MGMKEAFQAAAIAAFNAAGNVKTSVTYHSLGTLGTYDPATGTSAETGGSDLSVSVLLTDFEAEEIDGKVILKTDQNLLIPVLSLSVTPKKDDTVVIDSVEWQVQDWKTDPAEALWEIQIRKP